MAWHDIFTQFLSNKKEHTAASFINSVFQEALDNDKYLKQNKLDTTNVVNTVTETVTGKALDAVQNNPNMPDTLAYKINVLNNRNLLAKALYKCSNGDSCSIYTYGDSVTIGVNTTITYTAMLANMLPKIYNNTNITVTNKGHENRDTNDAVNLLQSQILDIPPDICFVMFGINDCRGTNGAVTVETYYNNLLTICNTLISNGVAVVLMTPTPNLEDICRYNLSAYVDAMKEVANKKSIKLIDNNLNIWDCFERDIYQPIGTITDGIHVNVSGHITIASKILTNVFGVTELQNGFLPLVYTKYCTTDLTDASIWRDSSLTRGGTYFLSGTNTNKIVVPFFSNTSSQSVYIETVKYNAGASYNIRIDGEVKKEVNTYNTTLSTNVLEKICDIGYGVHYLEILGTDKTTTSAEGIFHISAVKLQTN